MLKESLHGLDYIGDIRGRGLFTGIEFVTDRYSMNPLTPPQHFASRLKAAGLEHGLLLYPGTPVPRYRYGRWRQWATYVVCSPFYCQR